MLILHPKKFRQFILCFLLFKRLYIAFWWMPAYSCILGNFLIDLKFYMFFQVTDLVKGMVCLVRQVAGSYGFLWLKANLLLKLLKGMQFLSMKL